MNRYEASEGDRFMIEKRINDLEIRMTHLENYLNQINEIVLENGRVLKTIQKQQIFFKQQIDEVTNQLPGPESVKPPHY